MAIALPFHPSPRVRRILRYAGYVVLALVTFVFALQLTFPYNRVKDKIVELLSAKYEVTIGGIDRGIVPGRMYLDAVTLRTRPAKADEVATTFFIQKLEVDLGLLSLLGGNASVDLDAQIGEGHIRGNITIGKSGTEIHLQGEDLPSASLPMQELIGLPLSGKIAFSVELDLPNEKQKSGASKPNWQKAEGAIAFDCPSGCTFGDGKTKLKPKLKNSRQQAFAADGIDFGKVNVDSMVVRVTIAKGSMEVTRFDAKSQDGELHVEFQAALAPDINDSQVAGCLRFKGSESLQKREPKTHAAISTTGANLGPDNLFHIRLDGKMKEMKRLAQACGPAVKGRNMDDFSGDKGVSSGTSSRPNLTVQPDEPNNGSGSATPPTPPTPPPPPAPADAMSSPPTPPPPPSNPEGSAGAPSDVTKDLPKADAQGAGANGETPPPTPEGGERPSH